MDVHETRRLNLQTLADELKSTGLSQKEVAHELNLGASYLSQLIGGKVMGHDVARKIELARNLPHGWMDQPREIHVKESGAIYGASQPLRIDPETMAATLKLLRLAIENVHLQGLDVDTDFERDALPIALAYEFLFRRRQHAVTPENVIQFSKVLAEGMREEGNGSEVEGSGIRHARGAR